MLTVYTRAGPLASRSSHRRDSTWQTGVSIELITFSSRTWPRESASPTGRSAPSGASRQSSSNGGAGSPGRSCRPITVSRSPSSNASPVRSRTSCTSLIAMATVARLSSIASVVITSTQNPRVKGLLALRRRPDRDREGLLLVEGHDELAVALASGARPVALYPVPVAEAGHDELVAWLRERDLAVVIARPDAATPFTAADLTGGVALVVGAEHQGLSAAWSRAADAEVRIPMFGSVNSLNVAASAALLVYELLRQRGRLG